MQVTAKRKDGAEVSAEVKMPDNLAALVSQYGEDVVYNHARGSLVVAVQGFIRGMIDQKKTSAEIQTAVNEWKPGARKQGKTPAEKIREQLGKLSAEERAALLKEYKKNAAAAAQPAVA